MGGVRSSAAGFPPSVIAEAILNRVVGMGSIKLFHVAAVVDNCMGKDNTDDEDVEVLEIPEAGDCLRSHEVAQVLHPVRFRTPWGKLGAEDVGDDDGGNIAEGGLGVRH